ncbi:MAG: hypothetical protein NW206_04900 [Hyphomonadaceae bacterium]|nr:hypothetical protein [Hyphomonadaceae bacterium]
MPAMNERQRDLFLYVWSQRRKPGRNAVVMRGLIIGALGGVLFAVLLNPGPPPGVMPYDFIGQIMPKLQALALAVPAFAAIGWFGANRVWNTQEGMYVRLLNAGATVPERKPEMQLADRWPAIMVGVAVLIIAGFIISLMIMASTGAL